MSEHSLELRIAKLRAKRKGNESIGGIGNGLPASIRREPSLKEQNAEWHKQGYYLFFCFHNKNKFVPCAQCGRTQAQAELNFEEYQKQLAALKNKLGL